MSQSLLLTLVLYLKTNHLYWNVGEDSYMPGTSSYKSAESMLVGVTVCFIIFMAFEFLIMVLGVSLLYS